MKEIEIALQIALDAHIGQVDKGGLPYILHPLRVMQNVDIIDEKIVAVLHDVVEDSNFTFDDLLNRGISDKNVKALQLLTHEKDVPYMEYIEKISNNKLASAVKLSDLRDNSDLSRLPNITDKDKERIKKYRIATVFLDRKLNEEI